MNHIKRLTTIIFLAIIFVSTIFAVPTMNYSIAKIGSSVEKCISTAKISLINTGYQNIQTTHQHSLGIRGEFLTTIICASSGTAVIITNGTENSAKDERVIVTQEFKKNLKK